MGNVIFTAKFFGGVGSLNILAGSQTIRLDNTHGTETRNLPEGTTSFMISGFAPSGANGRIKFTITGAVSPTYAVNYPQGPIAPHPIVLYVTSGTGAAIDLITINFETGFDKHTVKSYRKLTKKYLKQLSAPATSIAQTIKKKK